MKEFEANKCDEIKIDDGPIINDICDNLRKCISDISTSNIDGIKTYINERGTAWSRFEEDLAEPVYAYDYSGNT